MNVNEVAGVIIENMQSPVCVFGHNYNILYANPAFEALSGMSGDQLRGKTGWDLPDELAEGLADALPSQEEIDITEALLNRPVKILDDKGGARHFISSLHPIPGNGSKSGAALILEDVTELIQKRETVLRAAREWRITFDSISDYVSIHDRDCNIIRMNRAFAALFGKEPKALLGKKCHELIHHADDSVEGCPLYSLLETNQPVTTEIFEEALGTYLEVSVSPIFDEEGEIMGCVHIAKDVTERKKAEEALRSAQEELFQSEKLTAIGRFASGLAHEIRNPLANIVAATQYCQESNKDIPDSMKEYLDIILRNAFNADEFIRELLSFARPPSLKLKNGSVAKVLESLEASVKARCISNQVALKMEIEEDPPPVMLDARRLEEAFLNFITNSLDAIEESGVIRVSTMTDGDQVVIRFRDTGEGIPGDMIKRIFEPFVTGKEKGSGLGLSLTHQIIRSHDGHIEVESEPGEYTEFTVRLPIADS